MDPADEEDRYRRIFRRAHSEHPACLEDEWLMEPCRLADGRETDRALVWSRRNGPWRQHDVLWVGAAPGNAGGMGRGSMGAHGTRIPFGGDIAGGNLDVLLSGVGLDRNRTFIVAALNRLPERGGGEPRVAELREAVGTFPSSVHLLRETILAVAPRLLVALGNVALRTSVAAVRLQEKRRLTLPGLKRLEAAGLERGRATAWPDPFSADASFQVHWRSVRGDGPLPHLLWILHPSAQNMSPYAGSDTRFHSRMVETMASLRRAVTEVMDRPVPPVPSAAHRPDPPEVGVYALPEWTAAVGPRHRDLDALWRQKGV
jgi:uracil-DNA glycosylase